MTLAATTNKIKSFLIEHPKMTSLGFSLLMPTLILEATNLTEAITHTGVSNLGAGFIVVGMFATFIVGILNLVLEASDDTSFIKNRLKKSLGKAVDSSVEKYNTKVFDLKNNDLFPQEQKHLKENLENLANFVKKVLLEDSAYYYEDIFYKIDGLKDSKKEESQNQWHYYKNFICKNFTGLPIISKSIKAHINQDKLVTLFELMDNKLTQTDLNYFEKIIKNKKGDLPHSIVEMLRHGPVEFFNQFSPKLKKAVLDNIDFSDSRYKELTAEYKKEQSLEVKKEEKVQLPSFFTNKKEEKKVMFENTPISNYLSYIKKDNFEQYQKKNTQIETVLSLKGAILETLAENENNATFIQEELFLKNDIDKIFTHMTDELKLFKKIEKIEKAKGVSQEVLKDKKNQLLESHQDLINSLADKVLNISNKIQEGLTQDLSAKQEVNRKFLSQKLG